MRKADGVTQSSKQVTGKLEAITRKLVEEVSRLSW